MRKTIRILSIVIFAGWILGATQFGAVSKAFAQDTSSTDDIATADSQTRLTANEESDDDFDFLEEEAEIKTITVNDPIAPWNRLMFKFNDKLYFWVLKPVSKGYAAVLPQIMRTGVKNFFYNIKAPIRIVGCLLQGKGERAVNEFSRFTINSTVGVLGLANPAKKYPNLNPSPEDLGQVLGHYGIGNGIYIVWPFLGPSTLRDTVGYAGDQFLNPVSYVKPTEARLEIVAFETVNKTSLTIGDYESLKDSAIKPYEAFRNAYVQYREKLVSE